MTKKIIGLCILICFLSCRQKERHEVKGTPSHRININRFDQTFYNTGSSTDSTFLDLYANQIMEVGEPGSPMFQQFDSIFRNDKQMRQIYKDCQTVFKDVKPIEDKLTNAFYRLHHFFPDIPYPKVYMHISGFGESIVSAPGILSASIDKYLGSDYPLYQTLFNPQLVQKMNPDKIVSDYMTGWVRSEFTEETMISEQRLVDYIIYEGKLLYLIKMVLPDERFENISSLNTDQLIWCTKNEKTIWDTLINLKYLYSSEPMVLTKYLTDAPTTTFLPKESPGRVVVWTGLRIVEKYMENKPDASIQNLFKAGTKEILSESLYRP